MLRLLPLCEGVSGAELASCQGLILTTFKCELIKQHSLLLSLGILKKSKMSDDYSVECYGLGFLRPTG